MTGSFNIVSIIFIVLVLLGIKKLIAFGIKKGGSIDNFKSGSNIENEKGLGLLSDEDKIKLR